MEDAEEVNDLSAGEEEAAGADVFEPTEDELVLHFLRPQLRGLPPRVAGAVLEADPCGAAPWDLLARHGLAQRGHFFAARGRRNLRRDHPLRLAVAGEGAWMHGSTCAGRSVTELGVVVRWSRVRFWFYARAEQGQGQQQRSTGWVMDEYEITDPGCYRRRDEEEEDEYWVLCCVSKSKRHVPAAAAKPTTASPAKVRWRKLDELEADPGVKAKDSRPLRT